VADNKSSDKATHPGYCGPVEQTQDTERRATADSTHFGIDFREFETLLLEGDTRLALRSDDGHHPASTGFRLVDLLPEWLSVDYENLSPAGEAALFIYYVGSGARWPPVIERPGDVGTKGLLPVDFGRTSEEASLFIQVRVGSLTPIESGLPIRARDRLPNPSEGYEACRAATLDLLERVVDEANRLLPAAREAAESTWL
jgi:hypothetical protein